MLTVYEDDQGVMLIQAIELGLVKVYDKQILDLSIDVNLEQVEAWCDAQWTDSHVLATIVTWVVPHDLGPDYGVVSMFHYSYRFFMASEADAMLLKLCFGEDVFTPPQGASIFIHPAK